MSFHRPLRRPDDEHAPEIDSFGPISFVPSWPPAGDGDGAAPLPFPIADESCGPPAAAAPPAEESGEAEPTGATCFHVGLATSYARRLAALGGAGDAA
jgi:hypothetical protein